MADAGDSADDRITLANVAPFRLGEIAVVPAVRQVSRDGRSFTLEPRIMQVLVALAQAQGAVVTRDELIERCWGGIVVGENAIQRAMSRIRRLATDLGPESFQLETISKVGYRIVRAQSEPSRPFALGTAPVATPSSLGRRQALAGAAAIGVLGFAGVLVWRQRPDRRSEAARELYEKGDAVREGGGAAHTQQSIAYFREATRQAPGSAEAWGGLALAYSDAASWSEPAELDGLAARARSAAKRALQLDPTNADARTALILLRPFYRNWAEAETALRAVLKDHPDQRRACGALAQLMGDVGRWEESLPWFRSISGPNLFIPLARYGYIHALWNAGRLDEAETALDEAWARWPKHSAIWEARVSFLAFTGRSAAALALAEDESARPTGAAALPNGYEPPIASLIASIRALQSGSEADRQHAAALWLRQAKRGRADAQHAIEHLSSLGRLDMVFAVADGLYLGRGAWAPIAASRDRFVGWLTATLFSALTAPMRADPRFARLVADAGLEDYWRRSGRRPDYRATA